MLIARREIMLGAAAVAAGAAIATPVMASGRIEARLKQLGIELPESGPAPVANYTPTLTHGNTLYVAGQIPFRGKELAFKGRVGSDLTLEDGRAAARIVGINMLALLKRHLNGDLDKIKAVVRIDGFVSSANDFFQQPQVMNGISDLMVEVFGEAGRHTRTAVGVNVLPLNAPCEINAEFAL
ncbi:RidA family protein [Ferrovibrio sp.]|jgi:enamine deaminase RidA (YjgF/YER057c/UK114 family)|uniref:RidA family protein n=1 Tax=Ferrovibrio sp. TaxID=1917215 RepID=UPI0035B4AA88